MQDQVIRLMDFLKNLYKQYFNFIIKENRIMAKDINIIETSKLITEAWQTAANHEKLSFEQTNALRDAMIIFDRIEQAGESIKEFLENPENDVS